MQRTLSISAAALIVSVSIAFAQAPGTQRAPEVRVAATLATSVLQPGPKLEVIEVYKFKRS